MYVLPASNRVDHQLNVVWIGVRGYAMAQIEDMRPVLEGFDDVPGLAYEVFAAGNHML